MIPEDLRYHKEHEWVRLDGQRVTLGISDFAQDALGDVVFRGFAENRYRIDHGRGNRRSGIDQSHVPAFTRRSAEKS